MNDEQLHLFYKDPLAHLKSKVHGRLYGGHFRLGREIYSYMLYNERTLSQLSQKTGINAFKCNEYEKLDAIATYLGIPIRKDVSIRPIDLVFDCRSFELENCEKEYQFKQEVICLTTGCIWTTINETYKEEIIENGINNIHVTEDENRPTVHDSSKTNTKEEKPFNMDNYVRTEAIKIIEECSVNIDYAEISNKASLLLKF